MLNLKFKKTFTANKENGRCDWSHLNGKPIEVKSMFRDYHNNIYFEIITEDIHGNPLGLVAYPNEILCDESIIGLQYANSNDLYETSRLIELGNITYADC